MAKKPNKLSPEKYEEVMHQFKQIDQSFDEIAHIIFECFNVSEGDRVMKLRRKVQLLRVHFEDEEYMEF